MRGSWRQLFLLAWNDVRLATKSRSTFFWMLGLPVAMMWIFGQSSQGSGGPPRIALAVEDRDGGWLARALIDELDDDQLALQEISGEPEPTEPEPTEPEPTEPEPRQSDSGDSATEAAPPSDTTPPRTLVLPEALTEDVLAGEARTLRLEVDPEASRQFGMGAEIHASRAALRVLGRLFRMETEAEGIPEDSEEAARRYAALAAEPPMVQVDTRSAGAGTPVPQGYSQSVPGILTMTVLMMTLIYGGVFLVLEKQQGMLRRQLTLPIGRGQVIVSKILGRLFIAGLQILLLLIIGRFAFGLSLGGSPLGLAFLLTSYAVAVSGIAICLGALSRTSEQASTVGWLLSMAMAGLGGCWWPAEVMPDWLRTASHIFPTAWAMDGFHALISFGKGPEAIALPSAVLIAFGALAAWVGVRFLKDE